MDIQNEQQTIIESLTEKIEQIRQMQLRTAEPQTLNASSQNLPLLSNGEGRCEELIDDITKHCDHITDMLSTNK